MRKATSRKPTTAELRHQARAAARERSGSNVDEHDEENTSDPLPEDPSDALAELQRRHDEPES